MYVDEPRPTFWVGSSKDDLRDLSEDIRLELGHNLFRVQMGLEPTNWRPMHGLGKGITGVIELRARDADGIARLMYVAKFSRGIYVLHAFTKKTQQTSEGDKKIAADRYKEAQNHDGEG